MIGAAGIITTTALDFQKTIGTPAEVERLIPALKTLVAEHAV